MATKDSKYECLRCGWIYDPAEGDPEGGIAPGTCLLYTSPSPRVPKGPRRRREIPPIGVADVSLRGLGSP